MIKIFDLKKILKYYEEIKIKLSKEIKLINESIILKIIRKEFESVCNYLFEKLLNSINEIFQKTKITKDEINIILVGTTKIQKIKEIIKSNFPNSKIAKIAKINVPNIQRNTINKILLHSIILLK